MVDLSNEKLASNIAFNCNLCRYAKSAWRCPECGPKFDAAFWPNGAARRPGRAARPKESMADDAGAGDNDADDADDDDAGKGKGKGKSKASAGSKTKKGGGKKRKHGGTVKEESGLPIA